MKKVTIFFSLVVVPLFFNSMTPNTGYQVGDYATNFKLKNIDGNMVSLSDYADAKGFMVIFTCNTCPYAKMYEERIIELHKDYADKGFPVIAINPNDPNQSPGDSFAEMKARAATKKYPFPYLLDETQDITRAYGATRTPHVFLLKKEGADKFKVAYIGAIDNNYRDAKAANDKYVRNAVEALLSGKPVMNKSTKAIGCGIKWQEA